MEFGVLDDRVQLADLPMEILDFLLILLHLLFVLFDISAVFLYSLVLLLMLNPFLDQSNLFGVDLFLELVDLMIHYLVSAFKLGDLILSL